MFYPKTSAPRSLESDDREVFPDPIRQILCHLPVSRVAELIFGSCFAGIDLRTHNCRSLLTRHSFPHLLSLYSVYTLRAEIMSNSVFSVISRFVEEYRSSTPNKLKVVDAYLLYILLTGVFQFVYCVLVGTFPFNSFLSGFISCVGCFILAGIYDYFTLIKISRSFVK